MRSYRALNGEWNIAKFQSAKEPTDRGRFLAQTDTSAADRNVTCSAMLRNEGSDAAWNMGTFQSGVAATGADRRDLVARVRWPDGGAASRRRVCGPARGPRRTLESRSP